MNAENKFARLMRNTGPARFFVPLGVILIVVGIILFGFNTDDYLETTGTITDVLECAHGADEERQYDVTIAYKADGKDYETTLGNMTGDYKVGEEMTLYYNPENPQEITNSKMGGFIAPILIVVGAAALVFGIYSTIRAFKKSRELDNAVPGGRFPSEAFENFKNAPGVTEYYFRFDGHAFKPGYIAEDADRKPLYEGAMTKQALVGARTYEFRDHTTGITETHEVGHTVTQTYDDEFFSAKSWFKFDGKNIWDVIHDRGIRISTDFHSKFPYCIYNIAQNGAPLARVETCGVHVHEDEAAEHKINIPTGKMYYRFWTASKDIDSIFLTIFAISETEQGVVE